MGKKKQILETLIILCVGILAAGFIAGDYGFEKGHDIGMSEGYQQGFHDGMEYTESRGEGYLINAGSVAESIYTNQIIGPFTAILSGTPEHPSILWMHLRINVRGISEDVPIYFLFFLVDNYFEGEEGLIFNVNATAIDGYFDHTFEYRTHYVTDIFFGFMIHDINVEQSGDRYGRGLFLEWQWIVGAWITVIKDIELPTTEGEYHYVER